MEGEVETGRLHRYREEGRNARACRSRGLAGSVKAVGGEDSERTFVTVLAVFFHFARRSRCP